MLLSGIIFHPKWEIHGILHNYPVAAWSWSILLSRKTDSIPCACANSNHAQRETRRSGQEAKPKFSLQTFSEDEQLQEFKPYFQQEWAQENTTFGHWAYYELDSQKHALILCAFKQKFTYEL